mmetsp:Transcript_68351/g.110977  ORF Transcript_68351/g.110977 Transcript_68351/m.110977 type:complete len:543 (-) Transcript_68351:86-1714(-)
MDADVRTAMDLSHAIGAQVENSSSALSKGVTTRKTLHVGLHLPLKKLAEDSQSPSKMLNSSRFADEDYLDVALELSSMINRVKQMVSPRTIFELPSKPMNLRAAPTRMLSPGGGVYDSDAILKTSHYPTDVSTARVSYKTSDDFLTALKGRMLELEVSPVKPLREINAETRRIVSENEFLKSLQTKDKARDIGVFHNENLKKDPSKDALLWSHLQQESQDALPHVHQLKSWAQEAEEEASRIREGTHAFKSGFAATKGTSQPSFPVSSTDMATSSQIPNLHAHAHARSVLHAHTADLGGLNDVGLETTRFTPHRVTAVSQVRDIMRTVQGDPFYLNDPISVGDYIIGIDGQDVQTMDTNLLRQKLQGAFDTFVDISLVSDTTGRTYKVRLLRHTGNSVTERLADVHSTTLQKSKAPPAEGRVSPTVLPVTLSPRGRSSVPHTWGIALDTSQYPGFFEVKSVLEGSAAAKVCGVFSNTGETTSVQTGDVLLSIEGESVEKKSATDTMALMISSSSATFLRESSSRPGGMQFTAHRAGIFKIKT